MSILPTYRKGRVCVPWWYGLGYPIAWVLIGVGIAKRDTMVAILTQDAVIALVVAAFVGAVLYTVLYSLSKFKEQKLDAAQVYEKVVASGRDPNDPSVLTAQERWDIQKVQTFDPIFLIGAIVGIVLACALAVGVAYFYAYRWIGDSWQEWGVAAFILGLIAAWFVNETVVKLATSGEWADKAAQAFQTAKTVVAENPSAVTLLDEYIQKYLSAGFSKKGAVEKAKQFIADHPDLIK